MSYDTNRTYAYIQSGKKLRLYKIVRSAGRIIDNQGRVNGGKLDDIIYPDEAITNGLRIEYTAIEKPFVDEDPETTANSSLTEQTSPKESTHINLNRILSLAAVDYVRAMNAERKNDIQGKEYYMREFWRKVADNESNKNKMYIVNTIKTFAVK
jgi:hypothetical protein|tara:strand:- start:2931 stop:3392 length:462 start_codon:yes stop_codon:yes gene_type:complete